MPQLLGKTVQGKNYRDQTRYPKVVTSGYERVFKNDYKQISKNMLIHLGKTMVQIINRKK